MHFVAASRQAHAPWPIHRDLRWKDSPETA
jgi:hypothetical protein